MAAAQQRAGVSCLFLFSLSALAAANVSFHRRLTVALNPGAEAPPPGGDLLHIRAVGDNDTLHFLFCSQGAPTLLLVHTNSTSSSLQVDWPLFLARNTSGSLRVEPESSVQYSSGVVFSRLLEYDDVNDTGDSSSGLFSPYELQNFLWSRLNLSGPSARLCGSAPSASAGSLCLQLSAFEAEGRGQSWPRLLHTANSSQLEVWLDGVAPRAARSRFLLELQAVGGAYPLSRLLIRRSIDDEYTPSIFQMSEWISSANGSADALGFVQWRPVAYRQSSPALENATSCRSSAPRPQSGEATAAASALIRGFYSHLEAFGLNVSFGAAGEPFYNSTGFLSWTLLVGVGSPPVDSFSPMVIAIMAVGLGAPAILLLVGGVWIAARKRAAGGTTAYEPIS